MPAVLRALQGGLETMYRVETDLDVCDFLVDGERREALNVERMPREQLLIKPEPDGLQLGLFVDERTLENLAMRDPRRRLDEDNLHDFLLAVEGVSHFVYVVHRARQERPVSAVELEAGHRRVVVVLRDGDAVAATACVVATPARAAASLLMRPTPAAAIELATIVHALITATSTAV